MSDDDRTFIEKTESFWNNRGLEWSPEKARDHFALHGPRQRAEAMDQLDSELRSCEPTMGNMRKYSELHELRQDLDRIHHSLNRVNR
jgi:hypothetical protein